MKTKANESMSMRRGHLVRPAMQLYIEMNVQARVPQLTKTFELQYGGIVF